MYTSPNVSQKVVGLNLCYRVGQRHQQCFSLSFALCVVSVLSCFLSSVSASVLTTGLAGGGQAGCADGWAGFITASVENSVRTGDAAFRSVSVSATFPTFTLVGCQTACRISYYSVSRTVFQPQPLLPCQPKREVVPGLSHPPVLSPSVWAFTSASLSLSATVFPSVLSSTSSSVSVCR